MRKVDNTYLVARFNREQLAQLIQGLAREGGDIVEVSIEFKQVLDRNGIRIGSGYGDIKYLNINGDEIIEVNNA